MTIPSEFTPTSKWARWICHLAQRSDAELAQYDIAEVNLRCAEDLPGTDNGRLGGCLKKVDDWAVLVEQFTRYVFPKFLANPERFQGSEARFRVVALSECLQRHVGLHYNLTFAEGDYDASDSRNLFIHGMLTGSGGTCATLPILYNAIGGRLGYPLRLAATSDHYFCRWDEDGGEQFCFDATGRGCPIHDADHYRRWPKPITAWQEQNNGYIRGLTRREELAVFAGVRANCLFDNFRFGPAIETFQLSHRLAPHKLCLHDAWGLADYTAALCAQLKNVCGRLQDVPLAEALRRAADKLRGPNIDVFREPAVENVLRILRNRQRHVRSAGHEAAIQELAT